MPSSIQLSVVIPCLNEEETIGKCISSALDSIKSERLNGEVIVADNGSTDSSVEIAKKLGAKVIHVPKKGYGAALIHGFNAAKGTYILMADGDDSYDFTQIGEFYSKLNDGFDLVVGNRFQGIIHKGAMPPLHKYLGNPTLSFIGRLFFGSKLGDFHCGIRAMNREKILSLDLRSPGMEFASELIVKSTINNFRIAEIPTNLKKDGRSRKPHLRTWRDGWRHLSFLLSYSPKWLFLIPGLLLTLTGVLFLFLLKNGPREVNNIEFSFQTIIISSFSILIGFQSIWFSILSKTFSFTKNLFPVDRTWKMIIKRICSEYNLIVYFSVLITGILLFLNQFSIWQMANFGEIDAYSATFKTLESAIMVSISLQSIFSHFLLNLMTRDHDEFQL